MTLSMEACEAARCEREGQEDAKRRVPKLDRSAIPEESYLSFASFVSGYRKGRSHRSAVSFVFRVSPFPLVSFVRRFD